MLKFAAPREIYIRHYLSEWSPQRLDGQFSAWLVAQHTTTTMQQQPVSLSGVES